MRKFLLFIIPLLMSFTMAMGQADANGFVTIGTGSQNKSLPIYPFMKYSYSQVIYLQSEINEAGDITKLHYYYSGEGNNQNSKDWVIYMGHTPKTEFATVDDWVAIGDLTQVYDGEVILTNTAGWIEIPLTIPFNYNNTDNLVVAVNEKTPGQGNGPQYFYSTTVTENRGLRKEGYGVDNIDPAAPGSGTLVAGFANVKLLIPKDYAFTVNAPTTESAIIGTSTQYSVTIENIGLLSDTFTPTITGEGAWTYTLYQADGTTELTGGITIAPDTFAEFIIQVTVPADATMGDTDTQNFTITAAGGSQTTQTFSITTNAKVVLTVPYSYGFEDCVNNKPVALWGQAFVDGSRIWTANSSNTTNNRAPRTGNFNAYLGTNSKRWLFTPSYFELSASKTYRFSVYARQDGINADKVSITLMYGTSATAEGMTEVAKVQTNIVGDEYQRIEGIFSPSADGNFYLGILGNIRYDDFSNYLSIDDISVEEIEFSVTSPLGVTVDAGMSHDYHITITNVGQNSDSFTPSIVDGTWTYGLYELDGTTALTGAKTIASGASYEFIARVNVPTTANFNDTDNVNLTVTSASGIQAPTTISITTTAFAPLPLPFSEGFENCIDQAPVALWGQTSVSGYQSWIANSSYTGYNRTPRTGDFNAYLQYNNSNWLFSPSNFELEASKTYRFSVYARQGGENAANASITLMYGTSATVAGMTGVIKELTGAVNGDYQLIEGTFSPTADGNYYVGILGKIDWADGTSYYLSIDDISLAETFDNDAALTSITSPADIVEFNAAHDFMVTLKNNGENNLTALAINWAIGNPVVASGVYNWTGNLARGEEAEVTLTNHTFTTPGDIAISATIDWAADLVVDNNTIEKSIYVEAQKCGYTINLVDATGDGWNGAVIGFKQNGTIVGTFGDAFTTGSTFGPISVDLEEGIETQIVVVNHNYTVNQIGFTVTDPFGYMVFHRATGKSFGSDFIFHTFTSSCQEPTPHTVTLTVADTEGPIEGAILTFNGIAQTTGADGIVTIADVIDGTYAYSVTKYGYVSAAGNMIVAGADVTETITLNPVTYSVTFTVTDREATPIEGATVTIGGIEHTTNTEGIVVVNGIIEGMLHYTATKAGYTIETKSFNVNSSGISWTIRLYPVYTVTLTVADGTTPIGGATVKFDGVNHITGTDGIVTFNVKNGSYAYTASKTGFLAVTGNIIIDGADVEETITLNILTYTLAYTAGANGSITGEASQTVNHGANGTSVTAVAVDGYHFVKWSDGVTDNPRTDKNVTANVSVVAEFGVTTSSYTLTYTAGANGSITGETSQTVDHGANGTPVTAVPNDGYHFVKWSDGLKTASRTDKNVISNITVTAEFANAPMVLKFNTNLSDGTTITLPLYGTVDVTVNWGDGASDTYTTAGNHDHEYTAEGTYTVSIMGSLTQFGAIYDNSANMDKLVRVTSFGDIGLTSLKGAFWKATNLVELPSELPSTITNLSYMLFGASKFDGNIGSWNVSNVTNMGYMFCTATKFNQDISTWDVSNVTNMNTMFAGAKAFNQDIGGWDVSKVTDMTGMFTDATAFNQDISTWDVSSVTSMERMFSIANAFNQNIGGWDVSKVTNMEQMFIYADKFNQDISSWDVSNVTKMKWMFRNAKAFDQNIGGWNITSVTDMTEMFLGATLSTANYNNILIGWAVQAVENNVSFHGGNSQYSTGAAADAREVLTGTYNWTITDGGETTSTAINTTSETNISIYPNPTHNVLNFNFAGEQVQTIKMVDITGKTVLEKTNVSPSETLDISNLANGLYLVVVQTDKENISYKIIKE